MKWLVLNVLLLQQVVVGMRQGTQQLPLAK